MNPLDDSSRTSYRADLLAEVVRERFGPIPWAEVHRAPTPLEYVIWMQRNEANRERRQATLREMDERVGCAA